MVLLPAARRVHRSLLKISGTAGREGPVGDAWKKGLAMVGDGDAGNRWGNNGKRSGAVFAVLARRAARTRDRQPSWKREPSSRAAAVGGFAARRTRGRDLAKLPPSKATPETETSSRVWCMFFHYACASSRKEDDTQYTYIFNVPKLHGTNSSLISGMSFCG